MENKKETSLFNYIASSIVDGELPKDFTLPRLSEDESQIEWADGAMDGVGIYHMAFPEISADSHRLMVDAVQAAAKRDFVQAEKLFCKLGEENRVIFLSDVLQSYIIEHKDELNLGNIYEYGLYELVQSRDRECVKYGLSLLWLFETDSREEVKEIVRIIGLSDEFSIFAMFIMLRWADGNNEVWQLAKKIHGWGRIHTIERIEPVSSEIKRWLLLEGVHNNITPAYSALTCWQKSDAEVVLRTHLTREEFSGIRDIIDGLVDEGPVPGISEIENRDEVIITFLNQAKQMASELDDYEVIRGIRIYFEDGDYHNPEIVLLCQELLSSDNCKKAVLDAVKDGRAVGLAQELKLEYKEDIFELMKSSFESKNHLCNLLMKDPEYKDKVLALFRQKLPLTKMKTQPTNSLGLGLEYWRQQALEYLLQELRQYPLEGQDFVETALQSAPTRTRNFGIAALEAWVSTTKKPLTEILPEVQELLCRLREIEPDEKVKENMDRLISGHTTFGAEVEGYFL